MTCLVVNKKENLDVRHIIPLVLAQEAEVGRSLCDQGHPVLKRTKLLTILSSKNTA